MRLLGFVAEIARAWAWLPLGVIAAIAFWGALIACVVYWDYGK